MLAVEAVISVQLVPPFVEYSIFTSPTPPVLVQVIMWVEPVNNVSPPLGEVTVIPCVVGETMENSLSLMSEILPSESLSLMRTRQSTDGVSGTVHG